MPGPTLCVVWREMKVQEGGRLSQSHTARKRGSTQDGSETGRLLGLVTVLGASGTPWLSPSATQCCSITRHMAWAAMNGDTEVVDKGSFGKMDTNATHSNRLT